MLKLSSIILQPATFEELGAENGFNEEIIQQCCVAVKQEHSRCLLQEQNYETNKQTASESCNSTHIQDAKKKGTSG